MPISDYVVKRDKFEARESHGDDLVFPCCACKWRDLADGAEPCRTCDHYTFCVPSEADLRGDWQPPTAPPASDHIASAGKMIPPADSAH